MSVLSDRQERRSRSARFESVRVRACAMLNATGACIQQAVEASEHDVEAKQPSNNFLSVRELKVRMC